MKTPSRLLTNIVLGVIIPLVLFTPFAVIQYWQYQETHREFMEIELKSLKSAYGVCEVIMNGDRKDLQDIMRDVCDKNLARQAELNKELGL